MVRKLKTTSGLDDEIGTFSLNNTQLYVGSVSDDGGSVHKALSLLSGEYTHGNVSYTTVHFFETDDAVRLLGFLDQALAHDLPAIFRFPAAATGFMLSDGQFEWAIDKFVPNWHGGGGLKGSLGGEGGQIITMKSAGRLRECIAEFFGISA